LPERFDAESSSRSVNRFAAVQRGRNGEFVAKETIARVEVRSGPENSPHGQGNYRRPVVPGSVYRFDPTCPDLSVGSKLDDLVAGSVLDQAIEPANANSRGKRRFDYMIANNNPDVAEAAPVGPPNSCRCKARTARENDFHTNLYSPESIVRRKPAGSNIRMS
jgi:hypothetical protein